MVLKKKKRNGIKTEWGVNENIGMLSIFRDKHDWQHLHYLQRQLKFFGENVNVCHFLLPRLPGINIHQENSPYFSVSNGYLTAYFYTCNGRLQVHIYPIQNL